jgi:hypothetical protein
VIPGIGDVESFGVVLMHPGVNVSIATDVRPQEFSAIVICKPALVRQATSSHGESSTIYIYHSTDDDPVFLEGVKV